MKHVALVRTTEDFDPDEGITGNTLTDAYGILAQSISEWVAISDEEFDTLVYLDKKEKLNEIPELRGYILVFRDPIEQQQVHVSEILSACSGLYQTLKEEEAYRAAQEEKRRREVILRNKSKNVKQLKELAQALGVEVNVAHLESHARPKKTEGQV